MSFKQALNQLMNCETISLTTLPLQTVCMFEFSKTTKEKY